MAIFVMARKRPGRPPGSKLVLARASSTNSKEIRKALKAGFMRKVSRGVYAVPVSLPTRHSRETRTVSVNAGRRTISLKGTGQKRVVPAEKSEKIISGFYYDARMPPTHRFQGGLLEAHALHEARTVNELRKAFQRNRNADPVFIASKRFGLSRAPTFKVAGVFEPLQELVEFRKGKKKGAAYKKLVLMLGKKERAAFEKKFERAKPGEVIAVRAKRALELAGIPEKRAKRHRLLLKSSVSDRRLADYPLLFTPSGKAHSEKSPELAFWKKKFRDFGFDLKAENNQYLVRGRGLKKWTPLDKSMAREAIVSSFAAGLANGIHACHDYMHASFSEASNRLHSSVHRRNVALGDRFNGAEIHDLETIRAKKGCLKERQARDKWIAVDSIRYLSKLLAKGERAMRGEVSLGFTSRQSKELYEQGLKVFNELLALAK